MFVKPSGPVDQRDLRNWWVFLRGADWRHPRGPDRSINGLDDHSVMHVAYQNAQAYAVWADKVIRTEAEWEHAARGGLEGAEFPWGQFTWQNLASDDGYKGTSPIAAFPPNGPDLFDIASNALEWTSDWYQPHHSADKHIPHNPRGGHILAPPGQPVPIDDDPKMIDCEPAVAAQARSSGVPAGQWITAIAAYRKVSEMARRSNTPLADGDRIWRHSKYA